MKLDDTRYKLACIIPTRDRPKAFIDNCLRMMDNQTVDIDTVHVVDFPPTTAAKDITLRYKLGYDSLRNKGFDCIFFIEDDDFYAPNYIETMLNEWEAAGKPDMIGTGYTIYYHAFLKAWYKMHHSRRASAMNTMLKADLPIDWPLDHDPYTDMYLWSKHQGHVFTPPTHISLGIKHGIGMSGGHYHTDKLHRYVNKDEKSEFLRSVMDDASYKFYTETILSHGFNPAQ